MPGSKTFTKGKSSTQGSRYTVQEDQYTQHRPPQFAAENIPSGLTAGSSNEPRDGLTQELESMALSGERDIGLPRSDPRDRSSSFRTSTSNRTPRSARPDIARYVLMQPQDPTKFSLTSETLRVFDNEQGVNEQYPNVPHWCTGPYSPGSYPFPANTVAAANLSDSMYVTRPARSQATDGSWVLVAPSDERQDRFDESICGAGAMFHDMPAEPDWNESDVR